MNERKIKVTIDALGRPSVEAEGFSGTSCEVATKPIEDALAGGAGFQRSYKDEWAASNEEPVEQTQSW